MLYPKIGIRPVIDGRWGGVRESLEVQTMGMANSAKKLIEENLKYPDGTPVQCVISNTTIGGGAEAAKCADQFATENVFQDYFRNNMLIIFSDDDYNNYKTNRGSLSLPWTHRASYIRDVVSVIMEENANVEKGIKVVFVGCGILLSKIFHTKLVGKAV